MSEPQAAETPWEDLRRMALAEYEEVSTKAHSWSSAIPRAINYYFDHAKPDLAPAGELVSREAIEQTIGKIDKNNRRALASIKNPTDMQLRASESVIMALGDVSRAIATLPSVARVPDAARALAEEIVRELRLDFRLDDNRIRIEKAIAAIIESHCGVARVPVENKD